MPQLAQMLCDFLTLETRHLCWSLEYLLMSGDAIPRTLPMRMHLLLPKLHQVSMGGATEGSIWSIVYDIGNPATLPDWRTIPYGHEMANQRMYVLDQTSVVHCPVWKTGQIAIGGVGVAKGYWGSPQKTATQFRNLASECVYLTGDLGRWMPNGQIEFLGR